ncbi:hypothetical protein [Tritonibacter aquimaris]|uniref:hypothetical protein n=1 Tax=Tritonibacter aquimaris TaxID=2663379 RepID=UPI001F4257A1|nr:hypothetical protein [Tritonibacter aquimaris]
MTLEAVEPMRDTAGEPEIAPPQQPVAPSAPEPAVASQPASQVHLIDPVSESAGAEPAAAPTAQAAPDEALPVAEPAVAIAEEAPDAAQDHEPAGQQEMLDAAPVAATSSAEPVEALSEQTAEPASTEVQQPAGLPLDLPQDIPNEETPPPLRARVIEIEDFVQNSAVDTAKGALGLIAGLREFSEENHSAITDCIGQMKALVLSK